MLETKPRKAETENAEIKLFATDPELGLEFAGRHRLSWLAYVRTSHVPLHQIVAPPWECFTDDEATRDWLDDVFLERGDADEEQPWWVPNGAQSNIGIMFRMNDIVTAWKGGPPITEVLIYAARPSARASTLNTTSHQSPGNPDSLDGDVYIHALPLSSSLQPPSVDQLSSFLPPALLDDSVIKGFVLADQDMIGSKLELEEHESIRDFSISRGSGVPYDERGLAKTAQTVSLREEPSVDNTSSVGSQQQSVNIATDANNAETTASRGLPKQDMTPPEPKISCHDRPPLKAEDSQPDFSTRNKAALQRIVLSGMRLYGLQQRKRPESRKAKLPKDPSMSLISATESGDEDFKSIYHQTYKAAAFAMRRRFADEVLDPGDMRDVVDQVLALFCGQLSSPAPETL